MELFTLLLLSFFLTTLILLMFLIFVVFKSIGFKNLLKYFKILSNKKYVLMRVYTKTGSCTMYAATKEGDHMLTIDNQDKQKLSYIINPQEIYKNEFNYNCLDYFEEETEPRSWRSRPDYAMSPNAFSHTMTNISKSETMTKGLDYYMKRYGKIALIVIGAIVGVLVFVILNQNDTIAELTQQSIEMSKQVAGNQVKEI